MPSQVDPITAHARLQAEPGAIYLDVRSVNEYDQGHPAGAWNIPILHATPSGMRQNQDFLRVALAVLPKDVFIAVGCKSGQRSAMACQALEQAGFHSTVNVAGGFHGPAGWQDCDLPSSTDATPGKTWADLSAAAG